ncbi:hypothetical protein [Ktedonospora formicarum]|nr:hypothetical protein [Ktedonospora formicarum]
MMNIRRAHLLKHKQQKKRRWWRYLDLVLIVLAVNLMVIIIRVLPAFQVTIASPHVNLAGNTVGLNAITTPLEQVIHLSPQDDPCSDPNATSEQIKKCLEGSSNKNTYTGDDKIKNPIAKGNALFFFTPTYITVDNSSIQKLWGLMLGFVDTLLGVIIMLNGLKIILTGSVFRYARAVEDLPAVLLAIIAAHISLTFIMMIIGLNNNMTSTIYTFAQTNPNIKRSASGFGDGEKKEYTMRVFFPTMSAIRKNEFETKTNVTWQQARDNWPTPDGTAPDGKGNQTKEDASKFKDDMVCTLEKINFDSPERTKLFGSPLTDPKTSELYTNIKDRSDYIINHSDKLPDNVKNNLLSMPETMLTDLNNFNTDDQFKIREDLYNSEQVDRQWYTDFIRFTTDMTKIENNTDYHFDGTLDYKDESDALISTTSQLFNGAGQAHPTNPGPGQAGDVVIFNCENDATGSTFQLVPDDLNFSDLFKNLQDLGNALKTVTKVLALMFLAQMIIRLFFIDLYIVMAPIGIACWALPGKAGQPVARLWLQGFLSTVMVQFVMVVALIVIQVLLGNVLAFVGGNPNHPIGNLKDGTLSDLMRIACLWFVFRIPSLLGSAPMRTMVDAGQMMSQAVSTTISMQFTQFQMVTQMATSGASLGAAFVR